MMLTSIGTVGSTISDGGVRQRFAIRRDAPTTGGGPGGRALHGCIGSVRAASRHEVCPPTPLPIQRIALRYQAGRLTILVTNKVHI